MLSTNFADGAPVWVDLGTPDVARAAGFYGSVFGWQFESAGPEAGSYGMFTQGGTAVAAAGRLTEQGAAPSWTLYFKTSDADATASRRPNRRIRLPWPRRACPGPPRPAPRPRSWC